VSSTKKFTTIHTREFDHVSRRQAASARVQLAPSTCHEIRLPHCARGKSLTRARPNQIAQAPFDQPTVPNSLLPKIEPSFEPEDLPVLRVGATGLDMFSTDTRATIYKNLANACSSSPDQRCPMTGDMVHWLFHM
jgi:hypothetical protein